MVITSKIVSISRWSHGGCDMTTMKTTSRDGVEIVVFMSYISLGASLLFFLSNVFWVIRTMTRWRRIKAEWLVFMAVLKSCEGSRKREREREKKKRWYDWEEGEQWKVEFSFLISTIDYFHATCHISKQGIGKREESSNGADPNSTFTINQLMIITLCNRCSFKSLNRTIIMMLDLVIPSTTNRLHIWW